MILLDFVASFCLYRMSRRFLRIWLEPTNDRIVDSQLSAFAFSRVLQQELHESNQQLAQQMKEMLGSMTSLKIELEEEVCAAEDEDEEAMRSEHDEKYPTVSSFEESSLSDSDSITS